MEESTALETPKQKSTRRDFGKRIVAATAVTASIPLVNPRNSEAASNPVATVDRKEDIAPDVWDDLNDRANVFLSRDTDEKRKDILKGFIEQIPILREAHEKKRERADKLWDLLIQDKDEAGESRYLAYYKKLYGNLKTIDPEKENPVAIWIENVKRYPERFVGIFNTIDFVLSPNSPVKGAQVDENLNRLCESLKKMSEDDIHFLPGDRVGEEANKTSNSKVEISVDESLEMDDRGREQFEKDTKRIKDFIDKYPYFRKLYTKVVLSSYRYGTLKNEKVRLSGGGSYSGWAEDVDKNKHSVIRVNLDHNTFTDEYWPEIMFAHEAFGHGMDLLLNQDLVSRLSMEDFVECLNFQLQVLGNPDWGDHDQTIPQLFGNSAIPRANWATITSGNEVSQKEYMSMIRDYPRNIILLNSYPPNSFGDGKPASIFDMHARNLRGDPIKGAGTRIDNDKIWYQNLNQFLQDYLPKLKKDAEGGNLRSKLILWGVENFREELRNTKGLWTSLFKRENGEYFRVIPNSLGDTATTWSDYCNFVVVNAVIYHGFVNGVDEIRGMFTNQEKGGIDRRVKYLLDSSRTELLAEGVAYAHYFGKRLQETPPYRRKLEHEASVIDRMQ